MRKNLAASHRHYCVSSRDYKTDGNTYGGGLTRFLAQKKKGVDTPSTVSMTLGVARTRLDAIEGGV